MTQRMKYNLDQAFNKIKKDYDDSTKYIVTEDDGRKIMVDFEIRGKKQTTILFNDDLKSIKEIYNIITSMI